MDAFLHHFAPCVLRLAAAGGLAALPMAALGNSVGPPRLEAQGTVAFSGIALDQSVFQQLDNVGTTTQSFPMNLSNSAFGGAVTSTVNGDFVAQYGLLSAWVTATGGEVPGTSQGRAVVVPTVQSYTGGSPVADFRDNLTITGPTGTTVNVKITNVLTGSALSDAYSSASLAADFQVGTTPTGFEPLVSLTPGGQMSVEEDFTLHVGDSVTLFANLYAGGAIDPNAMPFPPSGLVSSAFSIGGGAANPAQDITYISLPAGYGYTSDSGTVYLSAVPEPGAISLMLPLLAPLFLRRRKIHLCQPAWVRRFPR